MKFIDLFAGLGGFHLALSRLGHTCVFACEIDKGLQKLYKENFGIEPLGDIRNISVEEIPNHDILCAGFPCQPFSKAGDQKGLGCPKWGDLFEYVIKIIKTHQPEYIMLENVPNLEKHDNGNTWSGMMKQLESVGYHIDYHKLSPHKFGIPQIRERIIIVGCRSGLRDFKWPEETPKTNLSIVSALEHMPMDAKPLAPQLLECLDIWQEFIDSFPKDLDFPSFPIWSMEFGATYPFKETTPSAISIEELRTYKGSHGRSLAEIPEEKIMQALPSHARTNTTTFPKWKIKYIQQNRELYLTHKNWIDQWMPRILKFPSSLQKLEWNCKGEERNIWNFVLQIRASGVRVKRPTTSPSLIAQTDTQVPIIAWEKRYMTPRECATLQSMQNLPHLPATREQAFRALGNAINVNLVEIVAKALLPTETIDVITEDITEKNLVLT